MGARRISCRSAPSGHSARHGENLTKPVRLPSTERHRCRLFDAHLTPPDRRSVRAPAVAGVGTPLPRRRATTPIA
jgi:hypothetical protein